ncbi:MAG: flagellar basal body-associated FliL family protein [Pseudomonadota bacterium]
MSEPAPETAVEETLDEPKADSGKKRKMLIIIGGAVALLIAVGAGLYFTGMLDGVLGKKEHVAAEGGEAGEHGAEDAHESEDVPLDSHGVPMSAFVPIPDMIVSLNTADGSARYLRLKVQLQLVNPMDVPKVEAIMPVVIDQFQTYLREMRVEDLRGSKGLHRLQMELLTRVNTAAAPVKVKDVLFQEILIQ